MRISTRGRYGLRAMLELSAQAHNAPLPLKLIAKNQGIPEQYLEQLLQGLRRAGLIEGIRGSKGGYSLAKPPKEISVGDILRALEGPIGFVDCALEDDNTPCEKSKICIARPVWEKLKDKMIHAVDSISLEDLSQDDKII